VTRCYWRKLLIMCVTPAMLKNGVRFFGNTHQPVRIV
jgi:hypothetical protein